MTEEDRISNAIQNFLTLYTGSQRKNPRLWMDYFTSTAFLDAALNPAFTARLLEEITLRIRKYTPNREFAAWLSISYLFTEELVEDASHPDGRRRQTQLYQGAEFEGLQDILQIAALSPLPRRPAGNELALLTSFTEYRQLCSLADKGVWDEEALEQAQAILDRYVLTYIKDNCVKSEWNHVERHPAGLRLLDHFFDRQEQILPEELYGILWECLNLKDAQTGKAKLLYGRLRELVLKRIPSVETQIQEDFSPLFWAYSQYRFACFGLEEPDDQITAATESFFGREDLHRAFQTRTFVENYLLRLWLRPGCSSCFLHAVMAYYEEHPKAPRAGQVRRLAEKLLKNRLVRQQIDEDLEEPLPDRPRLACRPFLRHWLSTGFYAAQDRDTGLSLTDYMEESFPCLPQWNLRFLTTMDGNFRPRRVAATLEDTPVEIFFHLHYQEFRLDHKPVYRPSLAWQSLAALPEDSDLYFFLLPIAWAPGDCFEDVNKETARRLKATAAPREDSSRIASFLADRVCRLPAQEQTGEEGDTPAALPLELFAENKEHLYGCSWDPVQGIVTLFEQTASGRTPLPGGPGKISDPDGALSLARQLLEEALSPSGFGLPLLTQLPSLVQVQPVCAPKKTLESQEITQGKLNGLLEDFRQARLERLEFAWSYGALVFLKDGEKYACLYFDHPRETYYCLLSMPDVYSTVDSSRVKYLPFRLGHLPDYTLHQEPASILCRMEMVFRQLGQGQPPKTMVDREFLWSSSVSLNSTDHKYRMAMQKLGAFPVQETQSRLQAKFVFSRYPDEMETQTTAGVCARLNLTGKNRSQALWVLSEYIQKKYTLLRLTWMPLYPGEAWYPFHMVLLQEEGRYMMAYLREDIKRAEFYVGDVEAYANTEGADYLKDDFLGHTVPAYLVHPNPCRIRNCLDLILDNLEDLPSITEQPDQFALERPVNPRPYDQIRRILIKDHCPEP